jgi:beta-glucosidase
VCGKNFGDKVKNWMVINEPMSFALAGYLLGIHPPGKFGFAKFYKAVHYITMGQAAGGRALRATVKNGNIGTTFSCIPIDGWKDKPANVAAAKRVDVLANRLFIEPALGMGYATKDLPALKHVEKHMLPGDDKLMKFDFDFIGLQNYTRWMVKRLLLVPMVGAINISPKKMGHDLTEMGWEVYPEGIYRIIKQFAAYPGVKKIVLTENGAAFKDHLENGQIHDAKRIQYIKDYLKFVWKAKREGIDVGGYFIWSFMDNFEWAEGFRPTLGIVGVDYKTQERTVKDSGKWFADFLVGK